MSTTLSPTAPVERIKAVNHHLRIALDQVSDMVLILQSGTLLPEGPMVAWGNEAAARGMGVTSAELSGAALHPLLAEASWPDLTEALKQAAAKGTAQASLRLRAPGSGKFLGKLKATRGIDGEVLGMILTLAGENRPSPADAAVPGDLHPGGEQPAPSPEAWQQDMIETIRETARQVAHEFNNALTSIVLPVQLAIRAIPPDGELFDSLEIAHVSAQRASDLAKDFLDCFRPRSALRSRCVPSILLGRAIRLAVCAQNVTTRIELEEDLPDVEVDESQLERVLFNLIRNSCQAMPSGGRLRVAAVRRDVVENDKLSLVPGPYLQISVRDWGPGIPEEHLQHLFHGRFTTKPDGNGCGLPICYQIVRDHGGEMLVRSKVHVGTEFIIYLPALPPEEIPEEAGGAGAVEGETDPAAGHGENLSNGHHGPVNWEDLIKGTASAGHSGNRLEKVPAPHSFSHRGDPVEPSDETDPVDLEVPPSLLVVDDELGVRTALSQIAKAMGFEVMTVANSDEALQTYKDRLHAERPFSTVLLDLNLRSGLNGLEVFEALRRMDPDAVVVATSGQHTEGDVERFQNLGFAGFLAKPYSLEQFDTVMRGALAS